MATAITKGEVPDWLIDAWDKLYKTDSRSAAQKWFQKRTFKYRAGRWLRQGLIGIFGSLALAEILFRVASNTSYIELLLENTPGTNLAGAALFMMLISNLVSYSKSANWLLHDQLHSLRDLKRYWEKLPSTREAARRLADEQVITLAMTVLQGQKQLMLSSDDPVERQAQLEVIQRSAEEEKERMKELSSAFDFFKGLGLVTVGKDGGYGRHFAQAKKRLAASEVKPE